MYIYTGKNGIDDTTENDYQIIRLIRAKRKQSGTRATISLSAPAGREKLKC